MSEVASAKAHARKPLDAQTRGTSVVSSVERPLMVSGPSCGNVVVGTAQETLEQSGNRRCIWKCAGLIAASPCNGKSVIRIMNLLVGDFLGTFGNELH